MSKKPTGARESQYMGEGDYPIFSNKTKVMVSFEAKSRLTIREESNPLCREVYQGRSQSIVKTKWKVKAGEGVGLSKVSKEDISSVLSRKKVTIDEVVEERAIRGSRTAQTSMELDAEAFGFCTDKTEGFFGIAGEGIVDEISVSAEIAHKRLKEIVAMFGCCKDKKEGFFVTAGRDEMLKFR